MAVVVLVGGLLWGRPALAAQVRWSGDDGCSREPEVTEQIEAMIQRPLPDADVADFEIHIDAATAQAVRLTLTTVRRADGRRSVRVLQGDSCAEVTDAAAVAIALAIGSPPDDDSPMPPEVSQAALPPRPRDRAEPARRVRAVQRRPSAWTWVLGISGALDGSVTPQATPGGEIHAGLRSRHFRAQLEGGIFAPGRVSDASGQGGQFQLLYAAPGFCAVTLLGPTSGLLCVGYEIGRLNGEGEGIARPYLQATLWHALRAELGLGLQISRRLMLSARAGGAFALVRHAFVLDEPTAVHRPAAVSPRAYLGLELSL